MAKTRTIKIETAPGFLSVQVEAELVDRFVRIATDKGGPWRFKKDSFQRALDGAVKEALVKFLAFTSGLEALSKRRV